MNNEVIGLDSQINKMLKNKQNKSTNYSIPKNIPKKAHKALEDLENNHDNSWAVEMYLKNKSNLDNINIQYRGRKINGNEFWTNVSKYCKSLKKMGIKKGDEVPVMITNTPEFIYSVVALNLIGAVSNILGEWFAEDYLTELIKSSNSKIVLASDDINESMKNAIKRSDNIENIIMFSLTDSLMKKNGKPYNPYHEIDDKFGHFKNNMDEMKESFSIPVLNQSEFINIGKDYTGEFVEDMTLSDACQITYTSGTTKPGFPKGCLHSNRNYLSLARFKCSDVAPMPAMKKLSVLAHLPSYTQTVMSTGYTDPLYMGWTTICEPYYGIDFYPYSLVINKPNYTVETPEYEKYVAKLLDTSWKNTKMNYRVAIVIAGQELSPGLEKYLNKISREHKFGTAKLPFPLAPVTVSIAGGTTENGGFLTTLFKSLQEKKLNNLIKKKPVRLTNIGIAEMEILKEDGSICKPYERGMLYANTPSNHIGYVNQEYNVGTRIVNKHGTEMMSTGTPAYLDEFGRVRMVDRPGNDIVTADGKVTAPYEINDLIQADTKNIMESYIIKNQDGETDNLICHIEKQPNSKKKDEQLIKEIQGRLSGKINPEILDKMFIRIRSFEEGFPVSGTGKTNLTQLKVEGISDKCVKLIEEKPKTLSLK